MRYPTIRRDNSVVDDYHGTQVHDPYRWLEDPDSEETKQFVENQNFITHQFLEGCGVVEPFKKRLTQLWDYPKYRCPFKRGPRYFYFYNSGLQNQSVLYVQDSLDSKAEVFLDPNLLSNDGTVALSSYAFSEDGEYFCYALSSSGSDWCTIKFMKVATKVQLDDVLERVKFSCLSWTHDHNGIFYNMFKKEEGRQDGTETSINLNQKLCYHIVGTPQSQDVICAEFPDHPKWMCFAEVADDGRHVILTIREGCDPVNRLYYCDLEKIDYKIEGPLNYVKVVDTFEAEYEYVTNEGSIFTFKTNFKAPRYKVITINLQSPDQEHWTDLIAEHEKDVLQWASCVSQDKIVICYLQDVKSKLYIHQLSNGTRLRELELDVGTVIGFSGKKTQTEIFYQFASFLTPGRIYHCDFSNRDIAVKVFRDTEVKGFDSSEFETKQVFFPSKDGTKIPMFVVHRKGISLDGSHPCLLYGYGGFNIAITPSFSVSRVVFMQHLGGVVAIANIRGGGEYGETWHKAGTKDKKQNVFDDFQSAAEYLIANKYTHNDKLCINGGSNGGLLVGACANQRPDLFGCVVSQVGVMDMLRFQKFTIGHAWTTDFGSSDDEEGFKYLRKYSPLHNIKKPSDDVQYPATLLLTADHDDRVVPLHSFKFISELQFKVGSCDKQEKPLLIRIDTKSGHGAGKPTTKQIEETADIYGFISKSTGAAWSE